ncbi:hypothetical protein AGMMS50225_06470 [Betaproteobacteria bacterium]|nr:hypothetical protein AGMMS50225_06470 [Betaproteobacteria bacterium]
MQQGLDFLVGEAGIFDDLFDWAVAGKEPPCNRQSLFLPCRPLSGFIIPALRGFPKLRGIHMEVWVNLGRFARTG